ncbi:zinc ribbon domain-containing protein [Bifidobacterium minimum]|uniref:zinc ribbon domain-containing protein n=2 Tax=Bifidobacterium minimum TaxID=1693 RepID=UPI003B84A9E4
MAESRPPENIQHPNSLNGKIDPAKAHQNPPMNRRPPRGTEGTPSMPCIHCGHPVQAGAQFCSHCGRPVAEPDSTTPPPSIPRSRSSASPSSWGPPPEHTARRDGSAPASFSEAPWDRSWWGLPQDYAISSSQVFSPSRSAASRWGPRPEERSSWPSSPPPSVRSWDIFSPSTPPTPRTSSPHTGAGAIASGDGSEP